MSNESSAVNCRRIPLTVSCVSLTPVDPENTGSESVNREYNTPVLVFGETVIFCLTFLDAAGNACQFSANDAFELAVDEDYIHGEDHLMAYASGSSSVNVPGDWSEANLAQGRISIRVNCNTVGFQEKIGTDDCLTAYLEVKRTSSSSLTKSLLLKTEIELRNTILTNEQAPAVVGREIYSADEVDVLLAETSTQLQTAINAKTTESRVQILLSAHNQNTESHADIRSAVSAKVDASVLATVATSGDYDDLSNKPTIPSTAAEVGADPAGTASSSVSAHNSSTSAHSSLFAAKANTADLAPVATSGDYDDLSNKPTIPSTAAEVGADPAGTAASAVSTHNSLTTAHDYHLLPTGSVIAYAGSTLPSGYLPCYGAAYSRTTYAALYAAIGTTYGTGDGSTTFNVPNLTDRFIQGNSTVGTVKAAGLPNITQTGIDPTTSTWGVPFNPLTGGAFYNEGSMMTVPTVAFTGSSDQRQRTIAFNASRCSSIYGNSTTVQPPALTMNFAIKY